MASPKPRCSAWRFHCCGCWLPGFLDARLMRLAIVFLIALKAAGSLTLTQQGLVRTLLHHGAVSQSCPDHPDRRAARRSAQLGRPCRLARGRTDLHLHRRSAVRHVGGVPGMVHQLHRLPRPARSGRRSPRRVITAFHAGTEWRDYGAGSRPLLDRSRPRHGADGRDRCCPRRVVRRRHGRTCRSMPASTRSRCALR